MSGKNLTFKLILDGDSKGLVAAAKQSEDVTKKVFETIKTEAKNVQVDALIGELNKATKEISNLGDKSTVSASQLRDMSMQSQQMIGALSTELLNAQAELTELSQTKATPSDIQNAVNRVADLKASIQSVEAAFGIYEATATDAMVGVDKAASKTISEVQKFTSVDLTNIVSEAQSATRAIDSMGDGAVVSAKEVERIGNIGTDSINALERELAVATTEFKALTQSSEAVSFEKFNDAKTKVDALEDALNLTKSAFGEFNVKASLAMQSVAASTDKAANSAKQAGDDIYSALGIKPPTVINDAIANLSRKLEDFKANSKLPAEEITRVTQITEQEIARLKSELNGVDPAAEKANSGITNLSRGMDGAKFAVNALVGVMATIGIGLGVRELAEAADSYTNLSARINIATSEGGNFQHAMAGVHQVALATNTSLDTTAGLFTKVNDVGKQMGLTQQQTLDLTKTINMAIQTGGGSAASADAAITQLTQALQSGVLRGDEFNSIMEQAPGISKALAQSLGVTTSELRKMAENGELSAEKVISALQKQSAAIEADYAKFPTTIGNALQKISTQWQILIGEMDQANGSSAAVANALSIIADNLGILKILFDDIAEGVGWFQEKLSEVDPSTLEAIRSTLSAVYDTIKTVISSIADIAETSWSAFTSTLDAISPLFNAILNGKEEVSGLTTLFNIFKIALGVVSDGATGLNIALKLLLSGIQFISGGIYALSSSILDFLGFDTLAAQAQNASDALFRQAEKNASEANRLALESKSATREAIREIRQTEEEANQERITESRKTLDELKIQEEKHKADYKAISDERIRLEQQLHEARKTGNQAAIDQAVKGLAELDIKEKAYQTESQKITDAKIQAAQVVASAMIQSADAAGMAQLKVLNAQLAAQGLQAEFDSTGKVIVKAMQDATQATENQGNATDRARKAAADLGLDLDVSLNRVSAKFKEGESSVNSFVAGLEGLGVTGKQAADLTYEAWLKWLETAKSQAEIDFAKAKLKEFGDQGQISTSQVEQGLIAIKFQAQKLPDDIDPVTESFKRLGIETKENLKLAAQQALMDFINVRDSGKATAEGVQKAYEKAAQAAAASGDAGRIAAVNAMNAGRNLEVQIDETGKASVKSMSDLEQSVHRVRNATSGAEGGFRDLGQTARDEAQSAGDAWQEAINKSREEFAARGKGEPGRAGASYTSYSRSSVLAELKSMGYSDKEAQKLASSIMSNAFAADASAAQRNYGTGNAKLLNAGFEKNRAQGLTSAFGSEVVQKALNNLAGGSGLSSTGPSTPTPSAPSLPSSPSARGTDSGPKTTIRIEAGNGQYVDAQVDANKKDALTEILSALGKVSKST